MTGYVGADHLFHDEEFVRGWAHKFVPTPARLELFDMIGKAIGKLATPEAHVVELGIGPGYLARHILNAFDSISYEGVDFSEVMFDIARETLGTLGSRVTLTSADLLTPDWPSRLTRQPDAIISTWSLHDLGSRQAVADVYARAFETLPESGVLVNGDFIKPVGTRFGFEAGRFEIALHLDMLRDAGFAAPCCQAIFEDNIDNPTPADNYACLVAQR